MKFDNITDILLVICLFVPGFIFTSTLSNFFPQREKKSKELTLLSLLIASAANYTLLSPLIYYLMSDSPTAWIYFPSWIFIIFCTPIIFALITAKILQKNVISNLAKLLNLPFRSHHPTGWDHKFAQLKYCYLLISLKDGTQVAGYFGDKSLASSIPEHKDIYLEETYVLFNNVWMPVPDSYGLWVSGEHIVSVEFKK